MNLLPMAILQVRDLCGPILDIALHSNLIPSIHLCTDEEYQKIIANEDSDDEDDPTKAAILQFLKADADGSGSMSLQEFIEMTRKNQLGGSRAFSRTSSLNLASRLDRLEEKVDGIAEKVEMLCEHLTRPKR